jgi:hypothetical protein
MEDFCALGEQPAANRTAGAASSFRRLSLCEDILSPEEILSDQAEGRFTQIPRPEAAGSHPQRHRKPAFGLR